MSTLPTSAIRMELPDRHGCASIEVSMESFFDFSFWMAEELEDFVAQQQSKQRREKLKQKIYRYRATRNPRG